MGWQRANSALALYNTLLQFALERYKLPFDDSNTLVELMFKTTAGGVGASGVLGWDFFAASALV